MTDLDTLLRRDAQSPLPDNGFSARVMSSLPPRARARQAWLQPALVLGSAALGSVLAVAFAPAGISVLQGFADVVQLRIGTPAAMTAIAMAAALMVSAVVLAVETE